MNYQAMRASAADQIKRNGKPVALLSTGSSAEWEYGYDELGDKWTRLVEPFDVVRVNPISDASVSVYAVEHPYGLKEIDGTLIQSQDRRFYLAALDFFGAPFSDPKTGNRLSVDGQVLEIASVVITKPGQTAVLYEVQCRG